MKKKIVIVSLIVCILVLSIASTTMAYFTDTEQAVNTFTSGKVEIKLTETNADGLVFDSTSGDDDLKDPVAFGNVYPGINVTKAPVITNIGSELAYVGAVITIKNDLTVNADGNIAKYLALPTATIAAEDKMTVKLDAFIADLNKTAADITYEAVEDSGKVVAYKIYMVFKDVLAKDQAYGLFTTVYMNPNWDNDQMAHCNGLNIIVDAYAVQTAGFTSADAALQAAFPEVFH